MPSYFFLERFSQDGRYVASGGNSQKVQMTLSSVRMGKCLAARAGGQVGAVLDLAFTPDGKGLVSPSLDKRLEVGMCLSSSQ